MKVLVTGSCGLIGSEAVSFYANKGDKVLGLDNNLRKHFFGPGGDTSGVLKQLQSDFKNSYTHQSIDIRDKKSVFEIFQNFSPDFVIHTAAQPSHDWAASDPHMDFGVNAEGTLNLLEALRQFAPEATLTFLSTNKVYGDAPNHLPTERMPLRYDFAGSIRGKGINETLSVDHCLHSLFGASKLAADILCQEYGRYFGLKIGVFRGGCLTGSRHSAVPLHGFLAYLVNCALTQKKYTILGYEGKQVRDQIHSSDVISALECFRQKPIPGEAFNLGGGFENSASIKELIILLKKKFGLNLSTDYNNVPRKGDHICYYSDMSKFKTHYPKYKIKMSLEDIIEDMIKAKAKLSKSKKRKAA